MTAYGRCVAVSSGNLLVCAPSIANSLKLKVIYCVVDIDKWIYRLRVAVETTAVLSDGGVVILAVAVAS